MSVANDGDYSWTRPRADPFRTQDDMRITTGPFRYVLGTPADFCQASFPIEPTTRIQKWGASQVANYTKTDVESDLFNINRPGHRIGYNSYNPQKNRMNQEPKRNIQETNFPQTASRLNNPPCTGRSMGVNRFEYLHQNPQENVMIPFDWLVPGRMLAKDSHRPLIPKPSNPTGQPAERSGWTNPENEVMQRYMGPGVALQNPPAGLNISKVDPRGLLNWSEGPVAAEVTCPAPTNPPSVAWRSAEEVRRY